MTTEIINPQTHIPISISNDTYQTTFYGENVVIVDGISTAILFNNLPAMRVSPEKANVIQGPITSITKNNEDSILLYGLENPAEFMIIYRLPQR